jgi:hypothetical protein
MQIFFPLHLFRFHSRNMPFGFIWIQSNELNLNSFYVVNKFDKLRVGNAFLGHVWDAFLRDNLVT